jgi:hypothetical protein
VLSSQPILPRDGFSSSETVNQANRPIKKKFFMQVGEPQQVNGVQWRIWDITLSGSSTKRRGDLGNWLVNWPTTHLRTWVASVYLERLARALHLRWCWFQWRHEDIPWSKMDIPCGKYDKEFFHASTAVIVGNGKKLGIVFGLLALELPEFQSLPRVRFCAESQIKNSRQLCREFFI